MGKEIKPENARENQEIRDAKGRFLKGVSGNPAGKPLGTEHFKTKWIKFIEKVAEQNETTPDQVDEQMLKVAYKQIMSGDHKYWKDIMDRVYGQATQSINVKAELDIDERTREKAESVIRDL